METEGIKIVTNAIRYNNHIHAEYSMNVEGKMNEAGKAKGIQPQFGDVKLPPPGGVLVVTSSESQEKHAHKGTSIMHAATRQRDTKQSQHSWLSPHSGSCPSPANDN